MNGYLEKLQLDGLWVTTVEYKYCFGIIGHEKELKSCGP